MTPFLFSKHNTEIRDLSKFKRWAREILIKIFLDEQKLNRAFIILFAHFCFKILYLKTHNNSFKKNIFPTPMSLNKVHLVSSKPNLNKL